METCFHCKAPLTAPAAYLTAHGLPICAECLPILCEKYNWDRKSERVKRARGKMLEQLHPLSPEEMSWELETGLSSVPLLVERETLLSKEVLHEVASLLKIQGITPLEIM
jgi:hypothetical protein